MDATLRKRFISDVVQDIAIMNGPDFENMAAFIIEQVLPGPFIHRGLNLKGAPVKGTVDTVDVAARTVAEYSSAERYWDAPEGKIKNDISHAITKHPNVEHIVLVNSGMCGPSDAAKLIELGKSWAPGKTIDWFDARRLAEVIVDQLLPRDPVLDRLKPFLPSLQHVAELYVLSNTVPQVSDGYAGRQEDERAILDLLEREKLVVLHGMGGVGKTELACAIAQRIRCEYDLVVWVHADELSHLDQLAAMDVTRNGWKRNLLGLLKSHHVLLVLDNLSADIGMRHLSEMCGDQSRVLVTTQVAIDARTYTVGALAAGPDEEVLNWGVPGPCPSDVAEAVRRTVGGHPLALRILNGYVRMDGFAWNDVAELCGSVPEDADLQNPAQIVAQRVLRKHATILRKELGFFVWCGSSMLDEELLKQATSLNVVAKLQKRALLSGTVPGLVRLHDIVYMSAKALPNEFQFRDREGVDAVATFLGRHAYRKRLPFLRAVHRHHALIEQIVRAGEHDDALLLGYIAGAEDFRSLDQSLLPQWNPGVDVLHGVPEEGIWLRLMLIADAIEARFRRLSLDAKETAIEELEAALLVFSGLLDSPRLSAEQRAYLRHHRGKTLLKLQRQDQARAEFEAVIAMLPVGLSANASRLQLIRMLTKDPEAARQYSEEIFDSEAADPETASTDILLGAIEALSRRHMQPFLAELSERYRSTIERVIKSAAACGYEHPYEALCAVSQHWAYHLPELFLAVYDELPQAETSGSAYKLAQLAKAAGKAAEEIGDDRASEYFHRAAELYSQADLSRSDHVRNAADLRIRLCDGATAIALLDRIPGDQRDRFWHYRYSQALEAENKLNLAKGEIEAAISAGPDDQYASSMYAHRSELKRKLGEADWEADLNRAIALASNEKYRQELEERRKPH